MINKSSSRRGVSDSGVCVCWCVRELCDESEKMDEDEEVEVERVEAK